MVIHRLHGNPNEKSCLGQLGDAVNSKQPRLIPSAAERQPKGKACEQQLLSVIPNRPTTTYEFKHAIHKQSEKENEEVGKERTEGGVEEDRGGDGREEGKRERRDCGER